MMRTIERLGPAIGGLVISLGFAAIFVDAMFNLDIAGDNATLVSSVQNMAENLFNTLGDLAVLALLVAVIGGYNIYKRFG